MNPVVTFIVVLALASFSLVGCGKSHEEGHSHDGHDHGENAPSGASFKPGRGVILTDETRQSLGVETVDVTERKLPLEIHFIVQFFGENHKPTADDMEHAECTLKASGLLAQTKAAFLRVGQSAELRPKTGPPLGGLVLRVNESLAIGDAEVIVGVTNPGAKLKPGEFVFTRITLPREQPVTAVPKSALLRAADGTFVYTVNGGAYFRTAVKAGAETEGFVEITEGLLSGDVVVSKPVEKLWLIELRATKGGGHSH